MTYQIKNNSSKRSVIVLVVVAIATVILVGCAYYFFVIRNNKSTNKPSGADSAEEINLNPPTEEELNETERFKQNLADKSQISPSSDSSSQGSQQVIPVIGYLQQSENGNIESNGYISGIIDSDGICALTLEKDAVKVTETRQAMMDAQGMICGQIVISRNKLNAGLWKAYITYASSAHKGSSEERKIEIK